MYVHQFVPCILLKAATNNNFLYVSSLHLSVCTRTQSLNTPNTEVHQCPSRTIYPALTHVMWLQNNRNDVRIFLIQKITQ